MKKSISIAIQIAVLAAIGLAGILYILNKSPVESLGEYEKQEIARPNKGKSLVDGLFSGSGRGESNDNGDDDTSLTGKSGRYDESRIGK
jgi:hypothetical protein